MLDLDQFYLGKVRQPLFYVLHNQIFKEYNFLCVEAAKNLNAD